LGDHAKGMAFKGDVKFPGFSESHHMHSYSYRSEYFEEGHRHQGLEETYLAVWVLKGVYWVIGLTVLVLTNFKLSKVILKVWRDLQELGAILEAKRDSNSLGMRADDPKDSEPKKDVSIELKKNDPKKREYSTIPK
jgi:hypothetical protein